MDVCESDLCMHVLVGFRGCCDLWLVFVYAYVSGGVKFLCTCSFGIRCNAVLPGFISTPMTDKVPDKI